MAAAPSSLLLPFLFLLSLTAASAAVLTAPKENVTGGWTPIADVNDPHILEIAKFAVNEYNKETGSNLTLVGVLSGETQVVDGTNYRLRLTTSDRNTYDTVVFDQPQSHTRKLTSFQLSDAPIGVWVPIKNVSDPYVQGIAKFAVANHNNKSGSSLALVAVLSGETQLVSGTKYRLRLTASDGNTYETVVYDKPWANVRAVLSFQPLKGAVLDGWYPVENVSDPYVQDVAKFAVAQHNKASGSSLALVAVLSGDYQIVEGVNYRLLIETSDEHVYEAIVFDQRWTQTRNLTSFTLKQTAAVWQRIPDVSKPEIQDVAKFAVTEHNKAAGSNLVLVAVLSGEKQVVAGINHKLLIKTSDGRVYEAVVFRRRSRTPTSRKVISFKLNN